MPVAGAAKVNKTENVVCSDHLFLGKKHKKKPAIGLITGFSVERKSYIDRISYYGFKCEGTVANRRPWFQIKVYGFRAFFA